MQPHRVVRTKREAPECVVEAVIAPFRLIDHLRCRIAHPRRIDRVRHTATPTVIRTEAAVVGKAAGSTAVIRRNRPLVDDPGAVIGVTDPAGAATHRDPRANRQRPVRINPGLVVRTQEVAAVLAERHRARPAQSLRPVKIHLTGCRTGRIAQPRRPVQRQTVDNVHVGVVVARQVQVATRRHPVQRPA